jgi:lysophospholipase L1-like esterase
MHKQLAPYASLTMTAGQTRQAAAGAPLSLAPPGVPARLAAKRLTVAAVGASITAGAGAFDDVRDAWVDRLQTWLYDTYGAKHGVNVTVNNGAVPGGAA